MWFMYTKHLVYAANFTTFYYNVGSFFIIKKGNREWREKGVQNVQTEIVFFLTIKQNQSGRSKYGND